MADQLCKDSLICIIFFSTKDFSVNLYFQVWLGVESFVLYMTDVDKSPKSSTEIEESPKNALKTPRVTDYYWPICFVI